MVSFAHVRAAAETLRGTVHVTPVVSSSQLDAASGARVYLKCENFQRIGAFKFRGAYNAVSRIAARPASRRPLTIVTLSSGNHAQGIALACRLKNMPAHIVMHAPVNPMKRAAVIDYGATIYEAADRDQADQLLAERVASLEGHYVHAFNDPAVIAGQGTCALEFLAAVPELDVIMAPIGGGGLLSGSCVAGHALRPSLAIYACEPAGALDALHSVRENRIVPMTNPRTIAEGLRTSLGDLTLPILRAHLTDFFTVEEEEIVQAMRFAFERLKLVIEASSAVALAPLLRRERVLEGKRVGVVMTGGNVDLSPWCEGFAAGRA